MLVVVFSSKGLTQSRIVSAIRWLPFLMIVELILLSDGDHGSFLFICFCAEGPLEIFFVLFGCSVVSVELLILSLNPGRKYT